MTKKTRAKPVSRGRNRAAKSTASKRSSSASVDAAEAAPALRNAATSDQMAALFTCTTRQIELLAKEAIVVRIGRGQYDFARSTINYVAHLRKQAAGRAGIDPDTDTATANRDRAIEQTALARTKRLALEGQLIDVAVAKDIWGRIARGLRQFVLGLPNSVAHEVPTLTAHDIAAIKRVCAEGLEDASIGKGFELNYLSDATAEDIADDVSGTEAGVRDAGGAQATAANPPVGVGGT